jgi:hypothetical protein
VSSLARIIQPSDCDLIPGIHRREKCARLPYQCDGMEWNGMILCGNITKIDQIFPVSFIPKIITHSSQVETEATEMK